MHANKFQHPRQPETGNSNRPLATSAFSGEARLRELEHLAETARKVRDQAAAELTRSGSTHHIARDRIAAAERMLRKTQQEIAELRTKLGPAVRQTTSAPQPKPQEFELAVLLGHSRASFNREASTQTSYEIQQDTPGRAPQKTANKPSAHHKSAAATVRAAGQKSRSFWRTLGFAALLCTGIGLGATGTYILVTTGSVNQAAQVIRQGTSELVGKLRALLPSRPAPSMNGHTATAKAALSEAETTQPALPAQPIDAAQKTQEQQERAAAEQRLVRQIASLERPQQTNR